jgi:hypothetical protein
MPAYPFHSLDAPLLVRQATVLNNLKSRVLEATKGFITSRYDQKGNLVKNNITWEEAMGLRSIQQKVKEQEWVVMATDESGRLTANSKLNYLERLVDISLSRRH